MFSHPALRPRIPDNNDAAQYSRAVFYPVGAMNAVYEPQLPVVPAMTPVVNFSGNGILAGVPPNPRQLPQVYAHKTAFVAGVGGPVAGQIFGQGLTVPETTNGSQ